MNFCAVRATMAYVEEMKATLCGKASMSRVMSTVDQPSGPNGSQSQ